MEGFSLCRYLVRYNMFLYGTCVFHSYPYEKFVALKKLNLYYVCGVVVNVLGSEHRILIIHGDDETCNIIWISW